MKRNERKVDSKKPKDGFSDYRPFHLSQDQYDSKEKKGAVAETWREKKREIGKTLLLIDEAIGLEPDIDVKTLHVKWLRLTPPQKHAFLLQGCLPPLQIAADVGCGMRKTSCGWMVYTN